MRASQRRGGRGGSGGFTLIELMVAMVVSGIVVLGIFAFSSIQRTTVSMHERNVRVQQALEGAMWSMGQDLRLAGMPFARMCSELRVWDPSNGGRLINPGGAATPDDAILDAHTGEPFWVLRDGVQAHWNSSTADSINGDEHSAAPESAADSFDVIVADAIYTESIEIFRLNADLTSGSTSVVVQTGGLLTAATDGALEEIQQLFPPGSFILVVRDPQGGDTIPVRPDLHGQCLLLQVTGDVAAGASPTDWEIPIGAQSGFNQGLTTMLADNNGAASCATHGTSCDDWTPGATAGTYDMADPSGRRSWIVPVGRLRWSRYEVDYAIENLPYLVRYDIIGYRDGDPDGLGGVDYPDCDAGDCTAPQLHLPGSDPGPLAVAIGPMIEDMQVAVGCDGMAAAPSGPVRAIEAPEVGFSEPDPGNRHVDELADNRGNDEWLGNAVEEAWGPDCVYHGTGEYAAAQWVAVEGAATPAFRMSPQIMRVTLLGSGEMAEEAGGTATENLLPIEDRPQMESAVGTRQRFFLTERFAPDNLRWRDPSVL